jgi:hypothetical protein
MATLTVPDEVLRQAGLSEREALLEFACRLFDAGHTASLLLRRAAGSRPAAASRLLSQAGER